MEAAVKHSVPADPYLDWALATGFAGLVPSGSGLRLPLLVRRRPEQTWAELRERLPAGASLGARTAGPGLLGTVWLDSEQAATLRTLVAATQLAQPLAAGLVRPAQPLALKPDRKVRVVVGVVDRGGAFLNRAFRTPQGRSRLLAYWDQAVLAPESDDPLLGWRRPAEGYGRELLAPALQALCRRASSARQEALIYQQLGMPELVAAAQAQAPDHATHVLDTLLGPPSPWPAAHSAKPTEPDWAAQAPAVLVSVPSVRPDQSTGAPPVAQIFEALQYILAHAQALNPDAAVVINLSLGMQAGPHDGSLLIEQGFDELMRLHPRLLLVLPAGNQAGPALNAAGSLAPGGQARVAWRVQPRDPTDSFLELWCRGSQQACAELQLHVRSPAGERFGPVVPGQALELRDARQQPWLRLSLHAAQAPEQGSGPWRSQALLALAPTQAGERGGVSAGAWQLECSRSGGNAQPLRLSLWVQGDQPVISRGDWVQSHLQAAQGLSLGADGGLNALATGRYPLVVGASQWLEERAADYSAELGSEVQSAAGPEERSEVRAGSKAAPLFGAAPPTDAVHLLAAADASGAEPGLLAAGVLSGHWVRMNGTSVAAPVGARHWVNWLWEHGLPPAPAGEPARRWRELVRYAAPTPRPRTPVGQRPPRLELRPGRLQPRWL